MVISKLQGGLGNQMFQYAVARSLIKNNRFVYLDHEFLEQNNEDSAHFTARHYELDIFKNLRALKARRWRLRLFKDRSLRYRMVRYLVRSSMIYIRQSGNEIVSLTAAGAKKNAYLDGYFQSETYFKNIRTEILYDFRFPALDPGNEALRKSIHLSGNAVSLHIRRGDYLRSKVVSNIHGTLPLDYYNKAIEALQASCSAISLYVFSDDIEWARNNLKYEAVEISFVDINHGQDSWKDMLLMSNCKHHIIANSSFSWWGAWLSDQQGLVFAPSKWFNPKTVQFNLHDFIPDTWHIIEHE